MNATGNATGGAANATPNATGDGVTSDDLGTLAATVRPLRHAYAEYFTLAAWVLPLWVGTLENARSSTSGPSCE